MGSRMVVVITNLTPLIAVGPDPEAAYTGRSITRVDRPGFVRVLRAT